MKPTMSANKILPGQERDVRFGRDGDPATPSQQSTPDILMPVHVHGVELLHLLLTGLLLHVLEHLISDVLRKDGEQQTLLLQRGRTVRDTFYHLKQKV